MSGEAAFAVLTGGPCVLSTKHYSLRPLTDDDAADLFAHYRDPVVSEFLDIPAFEAKSDAFAVIDWAEAMRARGLGVRWRVGDASAEGGDAFVGTAGFHLLNFHRGRRGELGLDLGSAWQGRRVMDEVLPVVLAFGFEVLGLRRIEGMVTPGNDRCCRMLERHGFAREGVLRDYAFWKGRFWDQIVYSKLSTLGARAMRPQSSSRIAPALRPG